MTSRSEQAYERLKELILEAEPDTFFSVRKCAEELNFSYTPTREALLKLHSEGMLRLVPKVGFFTVRMDLRDITDIYQSRECVEQYVLPIVIPHLTDDDKKILRKKVDEQEEALNNGDFAKYSEIDSEFHCYMINLMNNKKLSEFYENIRSQYRAASNSVATEHSRVPIEEHRKFLKLVDEGKYEEAVNVIHKHTKDAIQRMREGYVRIGV